MNLAMLFTFYKDDCRTDTAKQFIIAHQHQENRGDCIWHSVSLVIHEEKNQAVVLI
jgi:hypothetical protein